MVVGGSLLRKCNNSLRYFHPQAAKYRGNCGPLLPGADAGGTQFPPPHGFRAQANAGPEAVIAARREGERRECGCCGSLCRRNVTVLRSMSPARTAAAESAVRRGQAGDPFDRILPRCRVPLVRAGVIWCNSVRSCISLPGWRESDYDLSRHTFRLLKSCSLNNGTDYNYTLSSKRMLVVGLAGLLCSPLRTTIFPVFVLLPREDRH